MDETRFDEISKHVGTDASRRRLLGGLIGAVAALLGGATALEAKRNGKGRGKGKGNGRGRGKGHGRGRGRGNNGHNGNGRGQGTEKIQVCHRDEDEGAFNLITVGAPARGAHEGHDDVVCELEPCVVATGCNDDGTCITEQAPEGTECEIDDQDGTCDAAGACVPDDDDDGDDDDDDDDDDDEDDDGDDDGGDDDDDGDLSNRRNGERRR
jgi:hypothetical protein